MKSTDGKKCVKCSQNDEVCKDIFGNSCINYQPISGTTTDCETCPDSFVSTDGKKCYNNPCEYDNEKCVKTGTTKACENYEPVTEGTKTTCKPCEYGLKSTDGKKCVNNCDSSEPYLLWGRCSKKCEPEDFYLYNEVSKICYKCDGSCKSCDYKSGECNCREGYEPNTDISSNNEINDKICKQCIKGYYSENGKGCINCRCFDPKKCEESTGVCEDECIEGYIKEKEVCSKCAEGYFEKRKGLCVKCEYKEEENSCKALKVEEEENDIETICKNYEVVELEDKKQCNPCNDGFYSIKGKKCFKCVYSQSQGKCVNADDQTNNNEDECQYFGIEASTSGFECKPCEEGKYSINGECVNCNCQTGKCTELGECLDERNEFGDNICVSGFYKDANGKCVNCHCEGECDTKGKCVSVLNEGVSVQCIEGYFKNDKDQCLKCTASDHECITSEGNPCQGFRYDEEKSSCVVVEDGYYSENGIEEVKCNCGGQCDKTTGKCDGNCYPGFYKNTNGVCVKCIYEDGVNQECKIPNLDEVCRGVVPDTDSISSLKECKVCPDGEYSTNGKDCNKLEVVEENANKVCKINEEIVEGFEVSEDGKSCKPCEKGFYSKNGKCIICGCKGDCDPETGKCTTSTVECESGYYESSNACLKCIDNCLECTDQNKCTTCEADYQKIEIDGNEECVKCRNIGSVCKYKKDGTTNICKDFVLENGKCTKTCEKNQSPKGDGISCINCTSNCESCNEEGCLKCETGYYLNNNKKCIKNIQDCIDVEVSGKCTKCSVGFYLNDNKCVNCNCKGECDDEGKCKASCLDEYDHLFNEKCYKCKSQIDDVCRFTVEENKISYVCTGHDSSCKYCDQGFYSTDGKNCVNCHCKDKTKCDPRKGCLGDCEDGYAKSENSEICDVCAKGYAKNKNNFECTECAEGFYMDEDKKCVNCNCKVGTKCDSNGKCTSEACADRFFYEERSGRCFKCFENTQDQVCSYKDGNNNLQICLGFQLTDDQCKKCEEGYYSKDGNKCNNCQCLASCDPKTGVCENEEECEEGYLKSDEKICSKCAFKYTKNSNGDCINCELPYCKICESGFYSIDNENCVKYIYNADDNKCRHYITQEENPRFIYDKSSGECIPCIEKPGFFYDENSQQCLKSHCSGITNEDGSCKDETCIAGFYYDSDKHCVNCNCKGSCDKYGQCSEICDENGENCSGICREGFFKYQPQDDINKFYCLKCEPDEQNGDKTCKAIYKDQEDIKCKGFELVEGKCQMCDEGEYSPEGKKCLKCNCNGECDTEGNCKGTCSKGYIHEAELSYGENNQQEPSGKCVKCTYKNNKKCYAGDEICINFAPDQDDTKEFGCLPCSEETFSDDGSECIMCLNNCAKCSIFNVCEKCIEGSLLQEHSDNEDECVMCTVNNKGVCMAGKNICNGHKPNGLFCQFCEIDHYSIDGKNCVKCGCKVGSCDQYTGECFETEECADGYYNRNGICVKCSDGCLKCESGDYCNECDGEAGYIKYEGEKVECVKCQEKDGKCQYSFGGEEGVCNEFGYDAKNNVCVKCENGIYAIGDGTKCVNCLEGCKECKNGNQCETCLDGFFKTSDKKCIKCSDNCKKCTTNLNSCDRCNAGFYVKNDQCVKCHCKGECSLTGTCQGDCETGYSHTNGGKCYKCVINDFKEVCEYNININDDIKSFICKGHDAKCQSCDQGFYSHDGKECVKCHCANCDPINGCYGECEVGYTKSESSDICDICDVGHVPDEENDYECSKCAEGYYKNTEKKCVNCNCDDGVKCDVNGKCTDGKCAAGYIFVESFGLCFKCSKDIDVCKYEIGDKQMVCEGFYLNEGVCNKCGEREFSSDGKLCKSCFSGCEKCSDSNSCEKCEDGFYKINENNKEKCVKCINNCAKCSDSTTCDKCIDKYFLPEDKGKSECFKCNYEESVKKCQYTDNDNKKVTCTNFELVIEGNEKLCKTCEEGYFSDGFSCNKCPHNCKECTGTYQCTKCSVGFYMNNLVNGSPCNRCSSQLDNCAECDSATECTKCIGGYYKGLSSSREKEAKKSKTECFNCNCDGICDGETGECTGDCKKGYYHEKEGEKCINCAKFSENCIKCDNEKCLECTEKFELNIKEEDQCVVKACIIGCKQCDKENAVCSICEDKYFKSNGSCEPCSNSCATCVTKESQCTTCNLPLILDNSKCVSCFNKYYGCESESCTVDSCSKCLEYFKTNTDGQCDKNKKVETPNFNFVGFGRYQNTKSKIIFRLYLKLKNSMMFNSEVTFDLKIITNGETTLIKGGKGIQTGTSDGYYAEKPTGKNTLVNIDCEITLENEISDNAEVYVENLFAVLVNDVTKNTQIQEGNLNKENIKDKTDNEIEENAEKKGVLYTFVQNEATCNNEGANTNLKLIGTVESKDAFLNKIFKIKTSEKDADCKLNKDTGSTSAIFDCTIETNEKGFTISNQDVTIENELTVSLVMKDKEAKLCAKVNPENCCDYCTSCDKGECSSCASGYYLSENYCFSCPNNCGSLCSSETECNNCPDGLVLDSGKCYSCFEKFPGCQSNSCQSGKCVKCLKNFKTDVEGECDNTKKPTSPEFKYGGFGRFKREGKKITFRLYLKITQGFMYNAKITFSITINKATQGRALEETTYTGGKGTQTGVADGDQAANPTASSDTANIDCIITTTDSDFPEGETTVKDVTINSVNEDGDITKNIDVDKTVDISKKGGKDFEEEDKKSGYIYKFTQTSYSCNYDGKNADLKLNGQIKNVEKSIDNTNYDFSTEENNKGNCKLYKKAGESDATLNCIISTNKNNFSINDKTLNKEYDSTAYVYVNNKQISCKVTNKEDSNDQNEGSQKSSSGGLNGGAIAGIVIGIIIVGVIIIGAVILAIYKISVSKNNNSSANTISITTPQITQKQIVSTDKLSDEYLH